MTHTTDFFLPQPRGVKKIRRRSYIGIVFLAFGLVMTLQNNLRFESGVGPGELCLALYILTFLPLHAPNLIRTINQRENRFALWFLVWVTFGLVPTTLISTLVDVPGVSIRDLTAYILSLFLVLTVSSHSINYKIFGLSFIFFLQLNLAYYYFFGGSSAWFAGIRFTGGAENPNQLAIYLVCAHVFVSIFLKNIFIIIFSSFYFIFFGFISGSDAYYLSLFMLVIIYFSIFFITRKTILPFFPFILIGMIFFIINISNFINSHLYFMLIEADEGGSRFKILANGVIAWVDTPFSFFTGHGAGVYSGLYKPFERYEAHNSYIDFLSIGGLFGFIVIFSPAFKALFIYYQKNQRFICASIVVFLTFILFHFVGRQPIFWLTILIISHSGIMSNRKPV